MMAVLHKLEELLCSSINFQFVEGCYSNILASSTTVMEGPLKLEQDQPMKHLASHSSSFFSFTPISLLNSSPVSEASVNSI